MYGTDLGRNWRESVCIDPVVDGADVSPMTRMSKLRHALVESRQPSLDTR